MARAQPRAFLKPLYERVVKEGEKLDTYNIRQILEPEATVVYLKNMKHRPIGIIGGPLPKLLPSWALLGIGFVGGSVMEIVTGKRPEATAGDKPKLNKIWKW